MKKAKTVPFTFPDSGKTIYVPFVSIAMIAMKLRRRYKKPMPPTQDVDYGDGRLVREFNYSHPDYKKSLLDWEHFIEEESGDIAIKRVLSGQLTPEQQEEVDDWKEKHPGEFDPRFDSDKNIWFDEFAIVSDGDFIALTEFVRSRSEPTEEAIAAAADGFPGDVQGASG